MSAAHLMYRRADLTVFALVVGRAESEFDLARAALLVAEPEYPGLDIAHYVGELDRIGEGARIGHGYPPVAPVVRHLYEELGFRGNAADYYDPRNSFLNEVLDRRVGIPITLGLVLIETCGRVGIEAQGISFPGHFLVRVLGPGAPMFIDPLDGRALDRADLRALHGRATGHSGDPDPRVLEPARKSEILLRMLNNLRGIYEANGDGLRLRGVLERIAIVNKFPKDLAATIEVN